MGIFGKMRAASGSGVSVVQSRVSDLSASLQGNRMNANVVDGGKALKILVDDQGVTKGVFTGC